MVFENIVYIENIKKNKVLQFEIGELLENIQYVLKSKNIKTVVLYILSSDDSQLWKEEVGEENVKDKAGIYQSNDSDEWCNMKFCKKYIQIEEIELEKYFVLATTPSGMITRVEGEVDGCEPGYLPVLLNQQDDSKFWWEFGEEDAEGYHTVTSYNSRKLLTAISKDNLQLKGTINFNLCIYRMRATITRS